VLEYTANTHPDNKKGEVLRGIRPGTFTGYKDDSGALDLMSEARAVNLWQKTDDFIHVAKIAKADTERAVGQRANNTVLTLYRGLHSNLIAAKNVGDVMEEPIPFSTTSNKNFPTQWVGDGSGGSRVIIVMTVPLNYLMIMLSYPRQDMALNKQLQNQEQQEVTLSPSILRIKDKKVEGNTTYLIVDIQLIDPDKALERLADLFEG
jgi:hypothetical protein